jgi:tetratricopeptide (TPR) repeat protein
MGDRARCPTCGSIPPEGSPDGMCPHCLLLIGLGDATLIPGPPEGPGLATAEAAPDDSGAGIGLRLKGEVARGGMGVVHLGQDPRLGRDLAVKVLLEKHLQRPEVVARFVAEARTCARLQHPGIVPVYEQGTLDDGRPYFTMKLVRGRTLAELLAARPGPTHDLAQFLDVFLRAAQAVAFAHSIGVIHRDLTPSNVMIGEFGEVLVMDWGLARQLPGDDPTTPGVEPGSEGSSDRTDRDRSALLVPETEFRTVMGTPGYMAPEQATGGSGRLDRRVDVFGLGSILCEILTGQPAYAGDSSLEVRDKASRADLTEAHARLDSCGAEADLVILARDCVSAEPGARPSDASKVVERLTAHFDGAGERLRLAELARLEAQAHAGAERHRRRLAVALGVSLVALVVLGAGALSLHLRQQRAQQEQTTSALKEVEILKDAAVGDPTGPPARWLAARDALRRLTLPLAASSKLTARARLAELTRQIEDGLAAAEADDRLLRSLEIARARTDERDLRDADALFEAAFREAGLDVVHGDPSEVGRRLASRPKDVATTAVAALDCWAIVRHDRERDGHREAEPWLKPLTAARAADPDLWRNGLRDALAIGNRDAVIRLAEADDLEQRPAPSLWLLGRMLIWSGQIERAQVALSRAWRAHPDDFWINLDLSLVLTLEPARNDKAETYAVAATALRPSSALARMRLGVLRQAHGDLGAAEAEHRESIRLRPEAALAHYNLGNVLVALGRWEEAYAEYRSSRELNPFSSFHLRTSLAYCLTHQGRLAEAEAELVEACRIWAGAYQVWHFLGVVRLRRGDGPGSLSSLRRAAGLVPPSTPDAKTIAAALDQSEDLGRYLAALRGEGQARDDQDRLKFLWFSKEYGHDAASARLYAEIQTASPELLASLGPDHRVAAARHAVRAATGRGQ